MNLLTPSRTPVANNGEAEMTQLRARALWIVVIWTVVAAGFLTTFFSFGGVETFGDDSSRVLAGAIFLACGVFGTPIMLYLTRARAGAEHIVTDERDDKLARKANLIGLTAVALYVFLVCIGLWEAYREPGAVPVGWMWFLAYSTMIFVHLSTALTQLILDFGHLGDG